MQKLLIEKYLPTERFSERVDNYVKFRPNYPSEIIFFLESTLNLTKNLIIADVGSGTGLLSVLFLKSDYFVLGIEPNKEMRIAGEKFLKGYSNFRSINARAEDTRLKNNSVDCIVAGQAYHWFDHQQSKLEFKRIIKPNGYLILLWNSRSETDPFTKKYSKITKIYSKDYEQINQKSRKEYSFEDFFSPEPFFTYNFSNEQVLTWKGLRGRTLSSSYVPLEGPKYVALFSKLFDLFSKFQKNDKVALKYKTELYYGKLKL